MDNEEAQWAEQCRRGIARSLRDRTRFGFVKTYRPVLDDAPFRVFNSMAEYRRWCHENLPEFLGFRIQRDRVAGRLAHEQAARACRGVTVHRLRILAA